MPLQLQLTSSYSPGAEETGGDRYAVVSAQLGERRRFEVVDRHQEDAVVAVFDSLRQASVEAAYLSLLHLQSTRRKNQRPAADSGI